MQKKYTLIGVRVYTQKCFSNVKLFRNMWIKYFLHMQEFKEIEVLTFGLMLDKSFEKLFGSSSYLLCLALKQTSC